VRVLEDGSRLDGRPNNEIATSLASKVEESAKG
jgi:hypothetical protein